MKLTTPSDGHYAGLTDLQLHPGDDWDEFALGEGLTIRRTYAHLMSSHTMAFGRPEAPGKHHPAPWRATSQFEAFDIHAELFIPSTYKGTLPPQDVARVIVCMMRLFVDPKIRLLVRSSHSLSVVAGLHDKDVNIVPIETSRQFIELALPNPEAAADRLYWVRNFWQNAVDLMASHAEFRLAMEAFEMSTFIPHHALTLVSLWGALEALFSPSTSELRFRVSVLIASYIHPPGKLRAETQKEIFALYDQRSAAAHGKPKHNTDHLMQTFNILQKVLRRMIEESDIPSKSALNDMLFGVE
jgi:hypothetical protein